MMNRHWISRYKLPLVAGVCLVLAVVTMCSRKPDVSKTPLAPPPTSPYEQSVAGIGIVEPKSELIEIGTDAPGIVQRVLVTVGDHVNAGTPLVIMDQREVDAHIQRASAALKVARIQSQQALTQFDLVWNLPDKRAVSRDEFSKRQFEAQAAKARVAQLEAEVAQWQTTKERLSIKAPISGEILEVACQPGEAVGGASQGVLIRMGDTRDLHIRVEIDETLSHHVKPTAKAVATPRGDTQRALPLDFVRIEKYVKPKVNLVSGGQRVDTRVMQVVYRIASGNEGVLVGQQMDVYIQRDGAK